ncbi:type II secretion system F family protein [Phenylobacterium montanum]|uniref:Type II secretion system F family protein n=1 Tax=Phenylobacterium montanum TaxID=2823693 RepID=A0A975IV85_9CAUL|nr:type II secretion system F family protein [Caulobacter sp. S6]QUD88578.1 type II secretion system F family protein [Caulobacter sp. S6]
MTNLLDLLIEILVFAAVFAGALLAERSLGGFLAVRRRIGQDVAVVTPTASSVIKNQTVSNRFLLWVQSATASKDEAESSKLRRNLSLAGFNDPAAPIWYTICRFGLALGMPIGLMTLLGLTGRPLAGMQAIVVPVVLCMLGLVMPGLYVSARASSRRAEMENEFPDALDLLVVCVEAGLGLEAAFIRVAGEVSESHPRIAREFGALADELSAGKSRADALRAMADRVDVSNVSSFVALLIQSDTLGVSVAQSLRTYSVEMREARFLKAEEKAMRIPVLMTVPIVACFMPVIIVALLLPPAIDVVRTLTPALKGENPPPAAQAPARR